MLKKFGMVSAGVTAALLAAAPLASAGECHDDGGNHGHHGHHRSEGGGDNVGNVTCAARAGDVKNNDSAGLLAGVGPILDGNAGQVLSCNSFLNDVLSHNNTRIASPLL